jgi:hypothetical protein
MSPNFGTRGKPKCQEWERFEVRFFSYRTVGGHRITDHERKEGVYRNEAMHKY